MLGQAQGLCTVAGRVHHVAAADQQTPIKIHQKHTAVAAALTVALDKRRSRELDLQLNVAERVAGKNIAGPSDGLHIAVLGDPFRRLAVLASPFRKIIAVEKNNRVGRRR